MNIFAKKRVLTGHVIKAWDHQGWGDSIGWSDYSKLRMVGWLQRKPKENDEIQIEMRTESGKIMQTRYVVTEVEYMNDPKDMFFITVMPFGRVGEPITFKRVKEAK